MEAAVRDPADSVATRVDNALRGWSAEPWSFDYFAVMRRLESVAATNLLSAANSTFESGLGGWFMQGDHIQSLGLECGFAKGRRPVISPGWPFGL